MKQIMAIITLSLFISPICFARGGGGEGKFHKKIFKQLNLSEQQKKELTAIRKNKEVNMKKLHDKKRELKDTMKQAMIDDTPDSKLRTLHNEISTLSSQMKTSRFEKMLAIRKILSPAQRKSFFEMKKKMGKRGHKHHSLDN